MKIIIVKIVNLFVKVEKVYLTYSHIVTWSESHRILIGPHAIEFNSSLSLITVN